MNAPTLRSIAVAQGFSMRKRAYLRAFTQRHDIRIQQPGTAVPAGADLLLWGSTPAPADLASDVRVIRVEDGFLRSVGLGADLVRPVSWVFDDLGIYYDAARPSRLEARLEAGVTDRDLLARARAMRELVVRQRLTKYNISARQWTPRSQGRPIILVAGQVEADASMQHGAGAVRSNMMLLQTVRSARPDAWVVYKPHPDVVAGLRGLGHGEREAARGCDEVLLEADMHQVLEQVDEVHVMTSLTGFEALLRGKPVWCYGQPFYAGYGLTIDRQEQPRRRTRRLSIDELVACALIEYPTYLHPERIETCSAEEAIDALLAWRSRTHGHTPLWRRWLRPLLARP